MQVFVKVKEGQIVLDPLTKQKIDDKGAFVEFSTFWRRRIKDGDVFLVEQDKKETHNKPEVQKKSGGK